jgi:hypothetical protein
MVFQYDGLRQAGQPAASELSKPDGHVLAHP